MAKRTRKGRINKKKILRIEILLISIIFVCSIVSVFFSFKISKQRVKYNATVVKYNALKSDYDNKVKEYNEIKKEIDMYDNLDEAIEKTKKEYFSKIKQLEDDILAGKSDKKIAYLTFDDGPYYNTYTILDILDKHNVKATFFTTNINGEYCFDNKDENCWVMYNEYINRGHTIANHTFTHAIFRGLYNSPDSFMDAVIKQEELIKEKTDYTTNIVRFPGGSSTAKGLLDPITERLRERGYGWVDWTAQDGDGGNLQSADQAWSIIKGSVNDNIEVILLHDYNGVTTNILDDLIVYLEDNGYMLLPLFYESNMINK